MRLKRIIRDGLHRAGVDIVRYDGRHFESRQRHELLSVLGVDLVLDVGANIGQFGRELRANSYVGSIVSFEPVPEAFAELVQTMDPSWDAHNVAVGAGPGSLELHETANSWSSSLRTISQRHLDAAPEAEVVASFVVPVVPLDSYGFSGTIHLKADTQGFELEVLRGATETLRSVVSLELELSLVPLYEGQALLAQMIEEVHNRGFVFRGIWPAFRDRFTDELLQVNALLVRPMPIPPTSTAIGGSRSADEVLWSGYSR